LPQTAVSLAQVAHYIAGSDTPLKGVFERTDLRDKGGNLKTPAARVLLGSLGWTSGSMSDRVAYSNGKPLTVRTEEEKDALRTVVDRIWI